MSPHSLKNTAPESRSTVKPKPYRAPFIGVSLILLACLSATWFPAGIPTSVVNADSPEANPADFPIRNPIDRFILRQLKENKIPPSPTCSDEEFVRRVYLDITGLIPTVDEARAFLKDTEQNKRTKLIDQLLDSERYGIHFSVMWGDLLREHSNSKATEGTVPGSYRAWFKDALNKNVPYDKFVTQLIASKGNAIENGAVNFYLRDARDRVETANMVSSVFMGTRMACAQCHDHPFAKWEQQDFHHLMSFLDPRTNLVMDMEATLDRLKKGKGMPRKMREEFAPYIARFEKSYRDAKEAANLDGMSMGRRAMMKRKAGGKLRSIIKEAEKDLGEQKARRLQQVIKRNQVTRVDERSRGDYRMPAEDGDNKKKRNNGKQIVPPIFPWDKGLQAPESGSRREALATFITSHPQFAQVHVNRLWDRLMGRGIVHPVDDFRSKNKPSHPEVLKYLSLELVQSKFDTKHVLRLILNSSTYQRTTKPLPENAKDTLSFSHQKLRRMTAEQLFDSILVATGRSEGIQSLAKTKGGQKLLAASKSRRGPIGKKVKWAYDMPTPARNGTFLNVFNQPDRNQVCCEREEDGSITQALELLNGNALNSLVIARGGSLTETLIKSGKSGEDIGRDLYLATLSRYPNEKEMKIVRMMLKGPKPAPELVEDFQWALLNTREFMFVK